MFTDNIAYLKYLFNDSFSVSLRQSVELIEFQFFFVLFSFNSFFMSSCVNVMLHFLSLQIFVLHNLQYNIFPSVENTKRIGT